MADDERVRSRGRVRRLELFGSAQTFWFNEKCELYQHPWEGGAYTRYQSNMFPITATILLDVTLRRDPTDTRPSLVSADLVVTSADLSHIDVQSHDRSGKNKQYAPRLPPSRRCSRSDALIST